MNYNETLQYIHEKEDRGIVPGLDNIERLLGKLGNPERSMPAIHIAGTNGKGSIMAYVETILRLSGLKVGRYISPAIFDYKDRWIIDGQNPSEEYVADIFTRLEPFVSETEEELPPGPTSFEIETAAAFMMYKDSRCDVSLVECGMGGRLDATNVFTSTPIVVLAKISYDHMQFLGETIEDIAREKLGIVKEGDILVTYPQDTPVMDFIRSYIRDNFENVTLIEADINKLKIEEETLEGSTFSYKNEMYGISLLGRHQIYNAITAIETVRAFYGWIMARVKDDAASDKYGDAVFTKFDMCSDGIDRFVIMGLKKTVWQGRLEKLRDDPPFYIDGAHNEDAWITLSGNLERYFTDKKKIFIIGVLKDKEYPKMLDILTPYMDCAITVTTVNNKRALPGETLAELIKEKGVTAEAAPDYKYAVERAVTLAVSTGSVVIACGSLSFVGDMTGIVHGL